MNDEKQIERKTDLISEKIIEGNIFSVIQTYGSFFISIFSSFLIARILSAEDWGYLILGLATISTISLILAYFPPASHAMLKKLIPQYHYENKIRKLRSLIFGIFFLQIIVSLIGLATFLLLFQFLIEQNIFSQICIILSPLIILVVIQNITIQVLRGFKKFKEATIIVLSQIISLVIFYFFIFLDLPDNPIIVIAYSNVFSYLISLLVSLVFIFKVIPKSNNKEKLFHLKEIYKISKELGIYIQLTSTLVEQSNLVTQYFLLTLGIPDYITYYKITRNSEYFLRTSTGIAGTPYQAIFSELAVKEQYKKLVDIYYRIIKYNGLIQCLMFSFMFFFVDIYIIIIYTETYLSIILYVQIFLFVSFMSLITNNLDIMLIALNKQKMLFKRVFIYLILKLVFLFIGIYFFGFLGFVIFEVISKYIYGTVCILIFRTRSFDFLKLKIKFLSIFKLFLLFFISLAISLMFYFLILNLIDFQIIFVNEIVRRLIIDSIGLIILLTVFYFILYITRTFTKEEIDDLLNRDIFSRNLRGLNKTFSKILIKFFPSEKKD